MDNIKQRIKKLLNLADCDAATEGEIENALRFADRLMAEHNLSREDIGSETAEDAAVARETMDRQFAYAGGQKHALWEGQLAGFVCDLIGGVYRYRHMGAAETVRSSAGIVQFDPDGLPMTAVKYAFYGDTESVALAVQMFSDLRRTVAAMARLRYGGVFRGPGRSYCEGFVRGAVERMRRDRDAERRTDAADAIPGCAIVITSQERVAIDLWHKRTEAKAKKWLKSEHDIRLSSPSRYRNRQDVDAYRSGRDDGESLSLSAARSPKLGSAPLRRALPPGAGR